MEYGLDLECLIEFYDFHWNNKSVVFGLLILYRIDYGLNMDLCSNKPIKYNPNQLITFVYNRRYIRNLFIFSKCKQ